VLVIVRPMFASMILDPIWQIYDTAVAQHDPEKAAKMALKVRGTERSRFVGNRYYCGFF
jgi:hypothetical protein